MYPQAQEIEAGAAEHLALERLEARDVPLGLAVAPREGERRVDGGQVPAQVAGKAAELVGAGAQRGHEPRSERRVVPFADEAAELLGERVRGGGLRVDLPETHKLPLVVGE